MPKPSVVTWKYWDACLFLDVINKTQVDDRERIILDLLDELTKDEPSVVAITSVLTIAEVASAAEERELHKLDPAVLARIEKFWAPDSPIKLVEVYPALALEARDLIRETIGRGKSIKPYDALHFATARRRRVQEFLTFDEDLLNLDGWCGFAVKRPTSPNLPFPAAVLAPKAQA